MTIIDDPHTLTGAYAVHALDDEERATAEEHLARCDSCAQEVRELTETAARLGEATAVTPRRGMKDEVMRSIATVRQDVPHAKPGPHPESGRPRTRRLSRMALAACVAVAAGLGGTTVWQHQRAEDARAQQQRTQRQAQDVAAVLTTPDARTAAGKVSGGGSGTVVVSASRDRAAFLATGLPTPPRGKVYQLWFDDEGTMRPAGLLDGGGHTDAVLMDGHVGRAVGMGLTVEPSGGSSRPTSPPVALLKFPA